MQGLDFVDGSHYNKKFASPQAAVAQLVEQLIRNQQVNGSSPFSGSKKNQALRLGFLLSLNGSLPAIQIRLTTTGSTGGSS
jgi:hypothetical protein